jgi:hypothetical protein
MFTALLIGLKGLLVADVVVIQALRLGPLYPCAVTTCFVLMQMRLRLQLQWARLVAQTQQRSDQMKSMAAIALALASCGLMGCDNNTGAPRTYSSGPATVQYGTGVDNSIPGGRGGFNNDDINGKSRNPYSTTPGTGPMNSNPVASGNTPR